MKKTITSNKKIKLAIVITILGFVGILTLLTMEVSLPVEVTEILESKFSKNEIRLLMLINPTILLFISVFLGTIFYKKVELKVPILEKLVGYKLEVNFKDIVKNGVLFGVISGILISLLAFLVTPLLPNEFITLSKSIKPTVITKLLYGGITEEILVRYGLMSFVIWLLSKIFHFKHNSIYWTGIILSALFFALGHLPIVYNSIQSPSLLLLFYIILGNSFAGILFGYLYWKKGLESAMIAHIISHLTMIILELIK